MTWLPETNELAPGVIIERRSILWAPLALAAALHAESAPPIDWEDFIRLCPAEAAGFARDASAIGQPSDPKRQLFEAVWIGMKL